MFCIVCGAEAVNGNYCKKHFLEKHTLFSIENSSSDYCKNCDSYFWKNDQFDSAAKLIKFLSINTNKTEHKISSCSSSFKNIGGKLHVKVTCTGIINGVEKTETHDYLVIVSKKLCLNCSRKAGGYHEAVIQLRGAKSKDIYELVMKSIDEKNIAGVKEAEKGIDICVIRKAVASAAAKFLRSEGYEVTASYKLVAEKKGQKLYRNFYVVR